MIVLHCHLRAGTTGVWHPRIAQLGSPTCCLPMYFHSVHFHLVPRSSVGVHWLQPGKPLIRGTRNKTQEGWLLSLEWQLGRWAGKAAGLLPLVHVVHRLGIYNRHPDQFGLLIIYLKSLSSPNRISFTPFFANLDVKNKWFLEKQMISCPVRL